MMQKDSQYDNKQLRKDKQPVAQNSARNNQGQSRDTNSTRDIQKQGKQADIHSDDK